jgi:hypothetical protein
MEMTKFTRRLTAWIAMFAIVLAALAPAISQAVNAARTTAAGWDEICTIDGLRLIKADGEASHTSPVPVEKGTHFEHCPFCFTHAGSFGLPPDIGLTFSMASGNAMQPSLYYQAPRRLFIWAAAQPRAPPYRS